MGAAGRMSEPDLRIGLTGGFGTGKSTVAGIFRELGAGIIDADELAREALQPGREEYRRAVGQFGEKILAPSGEIDRQALAAEVFADPGARERLNRIVHPFVIREMDERLADSPTPVTVAVIPLLFEAGLPDRFDYVMVVEAGGEAVRKRTAASRGMTEKEIERRRAAQLPLAEKVRRADFVIDNNGSLEETRRQVEEIWAQLGDGE
jgi:dephospho-CoA kinase